MNTKKFKKIIFIAILLMFIIFLKPNFSFASSSLKLNNLDFDVTVQENGDLDIIEYWDVYISDTNTAYKTFKVDNTYDEITNVSVVEILDSGRTKEFTESYTYNYHVAENYFQGLVNPDGDFEIAWGVNLSNSSAERKFEISYTVKNHVTVYNDCAEVYWKLIGDDFNIYCDKVTGKIHLPEGINSIDDLRVWAHGPLNGNIYRDSCEEVSFSVDDLEAKTYLEIRLAMPNTIFSSSKKVSENKLDNIILQETEYADEANNQRDILLRKQKMLKIVSTIVIIILIAIFIKLFFKHTKELQEIKKIKPSQKLDYFREIPDEVRSAGEAAFLYYYRGKIDTGKLISATMLNLCLKGYLEFEVDSENKKNVKVILKSSNKMFRPDEKVLFEFLQEVSGEKGYFSMKEFENYSTKHSSKFLKMIENMHKNIEEECKDAEYYDKKSETEKDAYSVFFGLYVTFGVSALCVIPICLEIMEPILTCLYAIVLILNGIQTLRISMRLSGLTQEGLDEKEKWVGLKKYMVDFSLLKEREVPELVLWEKYLVFATAFGVADKVIKQLKILYPQMTDDEYMRKNCTYMYMVSNSSNFNIINSVNNSVSNVNSVIRASSNYSSGSGSGGGFSSGGGFGRRWRRRRRSLKQ
jgi:uncharacterized membrane protein